MLKSSRQDGQSWSTFSPDASQSASCVALHEGMLDLTGVAIVVENVRRLLAFFGVRLVLGIVAKQAPPVFQKIIVILLSVGPKKITVVASRVQYAT